MMVKCSGYLKEYPTVIQMGEWKELQTVIGLEFLLALWMVLLRQMALEKDLLPLIYCFVVNTVGKERRSMDKHMLKRFQTSKMNTSCVHTLPLLRLELLPS